MNQKYFAEIELDIQSFKPYKNLSIKKCNMTFQTKYDLTCLTFKCQGRKIFGMDNNDNTII